MCGRPAGARGVLIVAQTVVSVGPYALTSRRPPAHRAARAGPAASPAVTSVLTPSRAAVPVTARTAGGTVRCVTPSRAITWPSRSPASAPGPGTARTAPEHRAITSSHTDASNPGGANASTRLPGPAPSRPACAAASDRSPPCVTTTPLGDPVDPDMYITHAAPPAAPRPPARPGTPPPSAPPATPPGTLAGVLSAR